MEIKAKDYSQVYAVLKMMGKNYMNKVPPKIFYKILEKKDDNYQPRYVNDIPLSEQSISKEALTYISVIDYNYWCENIEDKRKMTKILSVNEEKHTKEMNEKYSYENLFMNRKNKFIDNKNENKKIEKEREKNRKSLIVQSRQNFFLKIKNLLDKFFNKLK